MDLKESKLETVALFVLLVGVIMIIGSIWIYSKADITAYKKTLDMIASNKAETARIDNLLNSVIKTQAQLRIDVTNFNEVKELCEDNSGSIQHLQVYCTKLKENEIAMSAVLAKKQDMPTQVEVVETKRRRK